MKIDEYMEYYSGNEKAEKLAAENKKLRQTLEEVIDDLEALVKGWVGLTYEAETDEGAERALFGAMRDTGGQIDEYARKKREVLR